MNMTHYMELLSTHQPWNLLIYMAIPVILAETLAITELYLLFTNRTTGRVRQLSRIAGIIAGIYFAGIFLYLSKTAVIPLTDSGGWRGVADVTAVSMYLLGVVPLGGIALLELGLIYKAAEAHKKRMVHTFFIGMFLVVAHVAMIFGMLNPTILGWKDNTDSALQASTRQSASSMSMDEMTDDLNGKSGDEFDKAFVSEMIVHHQGAIAMATLTLENAEHQEVKDMANSILDAQTNEVNQMKTWQKDWGYNTSSTMNGHDMMGM